VDLGVLTTVRDHLRAVVAIGATPDEVEAAFAGTVPTVRADSMRAAVRAAAGLAASGDVVLLSPACASFVRTIGNCTILILKNSNGGVSSSIGSWA